MVDRALLGPFEPDTFSRLRVCCEADSGATSRQTARVHVPGVMAWSAVCCYGALGIHGARGLKVLFVLSKTLGTVLMPVNLLIGASVLGAVLLATRFCALGRGLLVTAVILLAVAAFSPVGRLLLYPLESRFPPWNPGQGTPDGIIVLGGSIDADVSLARDTPVVRRSPDRIIAAAALARRYPNARVVFTGGSARLVSDAREADYAAAIFESLGVDKARLIMERKSRNTVENVEFTKALVAPKPGERWVLITSAFHMPRSIGLFRKAGFPVEPYPVDWFVGGRSDAFSFTVLPLEGLLRTDIAMREWLGLIAYRAMGRLDDLLPGPNIANLQTGPHAGSLVPGQGYAAK